ncbi:MAG: LemA family protein [Clostridia bacterium]|nr:LemA family protein [Clostridia bacterium]
MTGLIITLVVLVVLVLWMIAVYNKLVQGRNKVKNAFAQIDTQLQRRFDLIPNLVETVKGYASHEKELLENVTASRSGYMNATTNAEKMMADNQLTSTLKSLFAVAENYPELKANANFAKLQDDLKGTEDKVAFSRQFYNDSVTMYNNSLQTFPNNIVANMFGFKEEELFRTDDSAKAAPKVQF